MMQRVLRLSFKKTEVKNKSAAGATGSSETCQIRCLSFFLITITNSIHKHSWKLLFLNGK